MYLIQAKLLTLLICLDHFVQLFWFCYHVDVAWLRFFVLYPTSLHFGLLIPVLWPISVAVFHPLQYDLCHVEPFVRVSSLYSLHFDLHFPVPWPTSVVVLHPLQCDSCHVEPFVLFSSLYSLHFDLHFPVPWPTSVVVLHPLQCDSCHVEPFVLFSSLYSLHFDLHFPVPWPTSVVVLHPLQCDSCHVESFVGFRYKCQRCYNYHLCQDCFWRGRTSGNHSNDHEVKEYSTYVSHTHFYSVFSIAITIHVVRLYF